MTRRSTADAEEAPALDRDAGLGRGIVFFAGGVGSVGLICCGGLALLLGASAGATVAEALGGPLRFVVAIPMLALAGYMLVWLVRRERRAAGSCRRRGGDCAREADDAA